MEKVRIVVAEPNRLAKITLIEKELKFQQKLVGGYLEQIKYGEKLVIMCNEEGKPRGLEPNRFYEGGILVGTFFLKLPQLKQWGSCILTNFCNISKEYCR